jgi:hypothetical protein
MMLNPPHPGEILRKGVIGTLGLSVTEAAQRLDMSRVELSLVLDAEAALVPILPYVWNKLASALRRLGLRYKSLMACGKRCNTTAVGTTVDRFCRRQQT